MNALNDAHHLSIGNYEIPQINEKLMEEISTKRVVLRLRFHNGRFDLKKIGSGKDGPVFDLRVKFKTYEGYDESMDKKTLMHKGLPVVETLNELISNGTFLSEDLLLRIIQHKNSRLIIDCKTLENGDVEVTLRWFLGKIDTDSSQDGLLGDQSTQVVQRSVSENTEKVLSDVLRYSTTTFTVDSESDFSLVDGQGTLETGTPHRQNVAGTNTQVYIEPPDTTITEIKRVNGKVVLNDGFMIS